jgi:diguanylate cyclase (GGDEF)-like protein
MGPQNLAPGRDPPHAVRRELLYEAQDGRVTRLESPDRRVIQEEPLGPTAHQCLRQLADLVKRLSGTEGVLPLAVGLPPSPGMIQLADVGGTVLARRATPMPAAEVVRLAERLAHAVAGIHRNGVMHQDINPANILLSEHGVPYLFNFLHATAFAAVAPGFLHPQEIVGAVPYLAPEQTGRTGRLVDLRADLYALGATLYELATGTPPFGTGDVLRIIHDHLARRPTPPAAVNPAISADLSSIIMHLLEKEPDDRYQTADGLIYDLSEIRRGARSIRPGAHDFPAPPLTPSRLSGRGREISELGTVFLDAMEGRCPGLLVSGVPGVGKTALVNELRPIVAGSGGWFVSGKFDQYRRDLEFGGVHQAFRALMRLMLAEPSDELAEVRGRLERALGAKARSAARIVPELATLLEIGPDETGPASVQRLNRWDTVAIMRAVVSRKRPVVFFVDDLQWAGRVPLNMIDRMLRAEEPVEGLLVVGAYRDVELDAAHPLTAMIARWNRQLPTLRHLRLANLAPDGQTALVADLLRLAPAAAEELAQVIAPSARGNPFDTAQLLDALRQDGDLTRGADGWRWDRAALRRRAARLDVTGLLAARAATLPRPSHDLLIAMACLAGQADLDLLEAATGLANGEIERRLAPASAAGLLVLERDGRASARFRHDRTQEAILGSVTPAARRAVRLGLARRLAEHPDYLAIAAEQYLDVADAVSAEDERRRVIDLFRRAAVRAQLIGSYALAERCLTTTLRLLGQTATDELIDIRTQRHAALYNLGRLEEADEEYQTISQLCVEPARRTAATVVQVDSLTNRSLTEEAMRLGLDHLRQLGVAVPDRAKIDAEIDRGLDAVYRWFSQTTVADDLHRARDCGRPLPGVYNLVNRLMAPARFCDQTTLDWLTAMSARRWAEDGPDRALVGPASVVALTIMARRSDYRTAHGLVEHLITVGQECGYRPEVERAQLIASVSTGHWARPLEEVVAAGETLLRNMVHSGNPQDACWLQGLILGDVLDCAPTLDAFRARVDEALAFAVRTGNGYAEVMIRGFHQLVRALSDAGDVSAADQAARLGLSTSPFSLTKLHVDRSLVAAILGRPAELAHHTAVAVPLLPTLESIYSVVAGRLLHALSLAEQARAAPPAGRASLVAQLAGLVDWMAARAADAPANFSHLRHFLEAELAWAGGDFREAAHAFDVAQREVAGGSRPWHRALILEHAARFYLASDMAAAGRTLLSAARQQYSDWGAAAKVRQLDWAYPALRAAPAIAASDEWRALPTVRDPTVTTGAIDLLGIATAAQALSSETSVHGLRTKVVGILSAMTGATAVHLLLRDTPLRTWSVLRADKDDTVPLEEAGRRRLLPPSVVLYAARTGEPLVLPDATRDDRFSRDPYFGGRSRCSLLAVPIRIRAEQRAMLLLENTLIRGAFSAERLDGILLLAGQLAVSFDNAFVYASLERKVAERTEQLAAANRSLRQLSITDPLTGLANRRRLDEVLQDAWHQAVHDATPVALAMLDIDHFKLFNDHFGHAAGDRCLQRIARCLSANIRDTDLAARFGGEEFAIAMPNADLRAATDAARRLRAAVAELAEPHPLVHPRIVTVSIGVTSSRPAPGDDLSTLIDLADGALYRAKRGGRNRVDVA